MKKVCTPSMSPIESILSVFRNPSYKGRSRRSEYWWFTILFLLFCELIGYIASQENLSKLIVVVMTVPVIVAVFYELSVTTRRLHDLNISGWWLIIVVGFQLISTFSDDFEVFKYIQVLVKVILFVICMFDGSPNTNKYGISPKYSTTDIEQESITEEIKNNRKSFLKRCSTSMGVVTGSLGCIFVLVIILILLCLSCKYLCNIDPDKYYVWYHGIFHGFFAIPNWIASFFDSSILCKAENYSTGYNIWWWIVLLLCLSPIGWRVSAGCILPLIIGICIFSLISHYICNISPEEYYVWYHGIWHGIFIIPNWIVSFFDSDVLCKAENYSIGYNIWWWVLLIIQILSFLLSDNH